MEYGGYKRWQTVANGEKRLQAHLGVAARYCERVLPPERGVAAAEDRGVLG